MYPKLSGGFGHLQAWNGLKYMKNLQNVPTNPEPILLYLTSST